MAHSSKSRRASAAGASGAAAGPGATKVCASCGRRIEWRAKWAKSWDDVRYCSTACRSRGVSSADRELEETIVATLRARPGGASVDLDEIRAPDGGGDASTQREQVRRAARRLADQGLVEWMQGGRRVDPSTARGRVDLRLTAEGSAR
ncbi:DUF2256 and DUF3253 domain-containing protein [Herbiconiux solani]|uniref:DUF2256 and DUF3253 domain-containing protein n=1 Tax=Herbiconiux solani TaxID=661329 RepID=UPI000A033494|nr:DUF2256 and DUF3253 domain-containing protein [Herbiconiux solani]